VVAVGALVGALLMPSLLDPVEASPGCGTLDKPETGIAGDVPLADQISGRADEGYNCGLAVVGYNSLGGRGGNANMAWAGDCAFIAGKGVAVVDVSDAAHPTHVATLQGSGSDVTVETLHAVDAADRSILVAGRYGLYGFGGPSATAPVDIWDVRDCRNPVLLSTMQMPGNVHNLTLTADAKTMWSTLPLQAADLTDPRHPTFLGNLEADLAAAGESSVYYAHEAWPSPDETRLYVGGQLGMIGDEQVRIIDTTGWPQRRATVVGRAPLPGHSVRPATIGGKPYLLTSDETVITPTAKGCVPEVLTPLGGASEPYLTDISDETRPVVRSQFHLPINAPQNCLTQLASNVNASVHYQDVDDPDDTTFAMFSMWHAGLRIVDVRDPGRPTEIAYFNPGRFLDPNALDGAGADQVLQLENLHGLDQAWGHVRYRPDTGHIWLTTRSGGFWVLELEPQVRSALGLPAKPTTNPRGGSPRPPESYLAVDPFAGDAALYCTLNATTSGLLLPT
jgi:hypothetical protein